MQQQLKKMLEQTCELFDAIDEMASIMKKAKAKGKLCNVLKFELVSFLACLLACDGRMSRVEAQLIRDYFELDMYPVHVKNFINEHQIGTEAYFEKVPECLKLAIKVDNYVAENDQKLSKGISEMVVELFKVFGKEMVVSDNKVKAEEQVTWSRYISMMVEYVAEESLIFQNKKDRVARPGTPIEVDYEMSLNKVGRIYTLYVGKLQ